MYSYYPFKMVVLHGRLPTLMKMYPYISRTVLLVTPPHETNAVWAYRGRLLTISMRTTRLMAFLFSTLLLHGYIPRHEYIRLHIPLISSCSYMSTSPRMKMYAYPFSIVRAPASVTCTAPPLLDAWYAHISVVCSCGVRSRIEAI